MKKSFEEHRQIILDLMNDELYVPMKEKELAIILQVEPEDRAELKAVLNSLLAEGRIAISKRGKYTKQDVKPMTGTFISHQKGFGFVEVEGVEEDYFIPAEYTGGAFHQDIVEIALLKKPDVLIMDEATSNLDTVTEHQIKKVLEDFSKDMTWVIIAHRLHTIKSCDTIYVMDKGRVVESGTHQSLLSQGGRYYRMVNSDL